MTTSNDNDLATTETEQRGRLTETLDSARTRASDAYAVARDRTRAAYGSARERASDAFDSTREGIESNPVAAVVGGLAIGAVLAALLPSSRREAELIGDWGRKLNDKAKDAARSARQAGVDKLDEFGVSAVKEKLADIAGSAKKAVAGDND